MPTQNHHWFPFSLEIPKQIHPVIPFEDVGPSKNLLEIARGADRVTNHSLKQAPCRHQVWDKSKDSLGNN